MIDHRIRSVPAVSGAFPPSTATIDWQALSLAGTFSKRLRIAPAAKCRSVRNRKTDNSSFITHFDKDRHSQAVDVFGKDANAIFRWPSRQPRHLNAVDFDQIALAATVVVWIGVPKRESA